MFVLGTAAAAIFAGPAQAWECDGVHPCSPPPPSCDGVHPCGAPTSICDAGGFRVTLTSFVPANHPGNVTGANIYTYEVCSPSAGSCSLNPGKSCLSHGDCDLHSEGTCNRECAVDAFHGLSHFDVDFPSLGDTCLSETHFVGGTCACTAGSSASCSVDPAIVLGDGACPNDGTVAKCDHTSLAPGDCIEMTLQVAGEENDLGLGATIVVSKESDCNESCLAGPACVPPEDCFDHVDNDCDGKVDCADEDCSHLPECGGHGGDGECLTRTIGFWGTHPWITNDYTPVTVCGESVGCNGPDDGMSNPSCPALSCDSVMEALGSIGGELKRGAAYVALIRQLAGAKLNLAATAALAEGDACSHWTYQGKTIQQWIAACEASTICGGSQSTISSSGCISALDAFNNSLDTGFDVTPAPFDRPPIDDHGNVSGADPSQFEAAHHGGYVIGKAVTGGADCDN
jgi:hypothetical protein